MLVVNFLRIFQIDFKNVANWLIVIDIVHGGVQVFFSDPFEIPLWKRVSHGPAIEVVYAVIHEISDINIASKVLRFHVLVIGFGVTVAALNDSSANTFFDEHNHVDVIKQL